MWNTESLSREQILEFLKSSEAIEFTGCGRKVKYGWLERVLRAQKYGDVSKAQVGCVSNQDRHSSSDHPDKGG